MNNLPLEIHRVSVFLITALALLAVVSSANGLPCSCGDLCVNETGWWRAGGDFNLSSTPIQHAVDNATAGETICVQDGNYTENVLVNKANLTIQSENGSANCIVTANNTGKHVFEVTANGVNITGFTVKNATGAYKAGIYLGNGVQHCTIANNTASNNDRGIYLEDSSNNTLTGNTANSNSGGSFGEGIYLSSSHYNNLVGNTANWNKIVGIFLDHADNNNLTRNNANSNDYGIRLENADNNNLTGNTANSNDYDGIELDTANHNNLTGNTVTANGGSGILLIWECHNNTLLDNFVAGHKSLDESFDVLLLAGASWTDQGELSFRNYETLELPLAHGAGALTLRLSQHGHDSAYVDYVALKKGDRLYEPVTAMNLDRGADICHKLVAPDYDVCDAWESTLELTWDSVPADTTLVMRAMEEDLGPGHGSPLYYPLLREGRTLSHTLVNDGGITVDGALDEWEEPTFSVFWKPDSPHPDGYTYGWLHADDQYVYAAVEITADNTADDEDWGALFVMVNGKLREFRVAPAETTWGQIGFQYTSAVPYEHRIYEVAIPLNVLNARIGDELHYGFGAYGTVSVYYAGIGLGKSDYNTLARNRVTDNGFGIYLYDASWNNITCNAVYKNTWTGFLLEEGSENNTIGLNGIVANFREEEEGYNFQNWQNVGVNAMNNYWGTTVAEEIAASIYGWREVTYDPFLDAWPPCAPGVPLLGVTKTVWNGTAWVKALDASINEEVRFNCTIRNIGGVNLTQLRFWDILDCSLVYAGNATLKIPGNETPINLNETPYLKQPYNYTFKQRILHPNDSLWDPRDPISDTCIHEKGDCPIFDELCPETKLHYLHGWEDTNHDGRVSTCDQLWLESYMEWYHVEHVPYTLLVNDTVTGESMYLESLEDYEEVDLIWPEVHWLEVGWTEACCGWDEYSLEEWNDTDDDGKLSVNDTLFLSAGEYPQPREYVVTEIAIDLVVSMEWEIDHLLNNSMPEPEPPAGAFASGPHVEKGRITGPIEPLNLFILEPGQSLTLEYNATDIRCGMDTNTFVAKGLYEGNWTYSNENFAFVVVPPRPAVETTLTVWNGTAWAKEVTVLVNETLNFSWMVHNNGTCCDLEDIVGMLTFGSNETTVDDMEDLAPCTEINGTLGVSALECGTYTVRWNVSAECEETEEDVTAEDTVTVTVACPELEVTKTVWNGTAWVKALNASINENVRFNCTITNTGDVNLTEIRFWDILDCSLNSSGNVTLKIPSHGVEAEITLRGTPIFKPKVLHPDHSWALGNPNSTNFTELCPEVGAHRTIVDWDDTNKDGQVSICDQLKLSSAVPYYWYHVDRVPYTLNLSNEALGTKYFDSVLNWNDVDLSDPNGTEWLEVCGCKDRYILMNWTDSTSSPDGNLSAGDTILLRNERTGDEAEYTLEELAIDLVVSREWEIDKLPVNSGFILKPNQTITIEYNATVVRCGVDHNTFRAKGNLSYGGGYVWCYSNEDKVTITVPCPGGYASDSGGTEQEVYYTDETVYATGSGFAPNSEVDIYITEDKHWIDGTPINSTIYREEHNVTTDGNGSITGEEIWPNPDPGEYDIVYDTNNNKIFDLDIDAADNVNDPGFIVLGRAPREQVPALTPVGIAVLIVLLSLSATGTMVRKKKR